MVSHTITFYKDVAVWLHETVNIVRVVPYCMSLPTRKTQPCVRTLGKSLQALCESQEDILRAFLICNL